MLNSSNRLLKKAHLIGALFLDLHLSDPWLNQLHTSRTPAVLLDNYVKQNPTTTYIGTDNNEAMYLSRIVF